MKSSADKRSNINSILIKEMGMQEIARVLGAIFAAKKNEIKKVRKKLRYFDVHCLNVEAFL